MKNRISTLPWVVGMMIGTAMVLVAQSAAQIAQDVPRDELLGMAAVNTEMHGYHDLLIPDSSIERPQDVGRGLRAHTNHMILNSPAAASTVTYETPASIHGVYKLPTTGGGGVIAVVDAYDYPTAENDLAVFSSIFNLPPCTSATGCFQKLYARGKKPAASCGWAQEAALDIEWAHAMAPNARILLVEAASNNSTDLLQAIDLANSRVSPHGGGFGEVTMSWGFSEFYGETSFDSHFQTAGIVYFASSGDIGGQRNYPGVSPYVVCAGGTSIHRDASGHFMSETAWSGSGGGPSTYESRPAYQNAIVTTAGAHRGAPDVSFDADPHSGVIAYDSTPCGGISGWLIFGGTSVSSPSVAGIVNLSSHFYHSSGIELSTMYSNLGTPNFRDIVSGTAGSFSAKPGWDFVTGLGSSLGVVGK